MRLWLIGLFSLAVCSATRSVAGETTSFWDRALLDMELRDVDLQAASLPEAWDKMGREFLVRSVLALDEPASVPHPFHLARSACKVRELIGAIVEAYPDYRMTQDPATGVLWIHPKTRPYESLLASRITIGQGVDEVPALQAVIRPLHAQGAFVFRLSRGILEMQEDAGAFPVTLPATQCTARDVVNDCCQAAPSRTFYVGLIGDVSCLTPGDILNPPPPPPLPAGIDAAPDGVSAADLLAAQVTRQPKRASGARPGALLFWRLGMGLASEKEPTNAELLGALANRDAHARWVARAFIKAECFRVSIEQIIREAPRGRPAIWASLAMLSMFNVASPNPRAPGLLRIQREMSLDTASTLDRGTYVLAAMEMARVGDSALLKEVAQWNLTADELASMHPDCVRITRVSKEVRAALKEANCAWAGLSANEVRDMENQNALFVEH